ncbi:MAG: preprotein translocase subunit SecG [Campylobacterales bacterium]|nr:preprotein translocase subunit SecG [Campylobacterales bacterium]
MTSTLLIVQIALAIAIIIAVLLQKSSSIGLGAYSGSNESMFGAKGPASFLAKTTFVLALLFIINTLTMGYLYNHEKNQSVADNIPTDTAVPTIEVNNSAQTVIPSVPTVEVNNSVEETTAPSVPAVESNNSTEAASPAATTVETNTTETNSSN